MTDVSCDFSVSQVLQSSLGISKEEATHVFEQVKCVSFLLLFCVCVCVCTHLFMWWIPYPAMSLTFFIQCQSLRVLMQYICSLTAVDAGSAANTFSLPCNNLLFLSAGELPVSAGGLQVRSNFLQRYEAPILAGRHILPSLLLGARPHQHQWGLQQPEQGSRHHLCQQGSHGGTQACFG